MGFTLQGFGPFLHWLTLVILFVLPVLAAFALFKLGGLPGEIAKARGHPQAVAINVCAWMGITTIAMWPVAMVWAHLSTAQPANTGGLSQTDTKSLRGKLRLLSQRIAALEGKLSTERPSGGA
jgi:hypothetical protein